MKKELIWRKMTTPPMSQGGDSWERQIDEVWACRSSQVSQVCQMRFFESKTFGKMTHYIIKKVDEQRIQREGILAALNSEEPTYAEKVSILGKFQKGNNYAIEVFPARRRLVDGANLYHMWEFQEKTLPFSTKPILSIPKPEEFEENWDGSAEYAMCSGEKTEYGRVGYLYLKRTDGKPLKWREKQKMKDEIIGDDLIAVEVISSNMSHLKYTCLICLPMDYKLDFGIHSEDK